MRVVYAGDKDTWLQDWTLLAPDSVNTGTFHLTPQSGRVQISYPNADGTRTYFNGSAWVAGAAIPLTTTIAGKVSKYGPITYPQSARGRHVLWEGWETRNKAATFGVSEVYVSDETPDVEVVGTESV